MYRDIIIRVHYYRAMECFDTLTVQNSAKKQKL